MKMRCTKMTPLWHQLKWCLVDLHWACVWNCSLFTIYILLHYMCYPPFIWVSKFKVYKFIHYIMPSKNSHNGMKKAPTMQFVAFYRCKNYHCTNLWLNGIQPSLILLFTPGLFLLWHVRMSSVGKVCDVLQVTLSALYNLFIILLFVNLYGSG